MPGPGIAVTAAGPTLGLPCPVQMDIAGCKIIPGAADVCRWVLLGEYRRTARGEPPTTRSAGNFVGGEVNQ